MPKTSRWHRVVLPDDHLRKLKQDLAECDAAAESATRLKPDPDDPPRPDDESS